MRSRKVLAGLRRGAAAVVVWCGLAAVWCGTAEAATVTISCGSTGQDQLVCREAAEAWAKRTGNEARVLAAPSSSSDRLALYQQFLAAKSPDIDVYVVDVIWPGLLATHLEDLTGKIGPSVLAQHFPAIVQNNTVGGRLLALPYFTDAGLLYYRADLLQKYGVKPPATWDELAAAAERIATAERAAGQADMQGFVWQGKAYEGLTVNALEWIASSGGGTIVDEEGKVTIANPAAARALDRAASWVGRISPRGVLNYTEEEARGVFQSGNAVFMRNWPYAWALAQGEGSPVKGKVGVSPLPKGGAEDRSAGVLGGWNLAISKYARNKDAALDLVLFMASPEQQKLRAVRHSLNPTMPALYADPDVLRAVPFFGDLRDVFTTAVARPSRIVDGRYNQVSSEFWDTVHGVLAAGGGAEPQLAALQRRLERLRRGGRWE